MLHFHAEPVTRNRRGNLARVYVCQAECWERIGYHAGDEPVPAREHPADAAELCSAVRYSALGSPEVVGHSATARTTREVFALPSGF